MAEFVTSGRCLANQGKEIFHLGFLSRPQSYRGTVSVQQAPVHGHANVVKSRHTKLRSLAYADSLAIP